MLFLGIHGFVGFSNEKSMATSFAIDAEVVKDEDRLLVVVQEKKNG